MAENKKILPIAGLALAAFLLMGGKKASAAQSGEKVEDTIDKIPDDSIEDEIPKKPSDAVKVGAITNVEKQNASIVYNDASNVAAFLGVDRPSGSTDLNWASSLTLWLTYGTNKSHCPKYINIGCSSPNGGALIPMKKLSVDMAKVDGKGYDYWSKVWLRIRDYIKSNYGLK